MKDIFKKLIRMIIIIKLGISVYCYFSAFTYVTILFPIVANLGILLMLSIGISKRKILVKEFSIWVSVIIIITLIDINTVDIGNKMIFNTKSKLCISPKYTHSIIVEQTQLLGEKTVNIYEVKLGIMKRELATQLIGNNIKVKWVNDTKILIIIDGNNNIIDLK